VPGEVRAATGRRVECGFVNIHDPESVETLAAQAKNLSPRIDIFVNNAGGQLAQPARDYKPTEWHALIDINLTGTWNMTQAFGLPMLDGDGGSIANVIAVVGRGIPGIAHPGAARVGVLDLSRVLAFEWGPKVRVNCVAPGPLRTAGFDQTYEDEMAIFATDGSPIPRFELPEEVAYAVTFLASPAASWITGDVISVAGGKQVYGRNRALFVEAFGRK
jgi:citronellol/citronellal dehydrogenase